MIRGSLKAFFFFVVLTVAVGVAAAQESPANAAPGQVQPGRNRGARSARRAAQPRGPLMPQPSAQMKRLSLALAGRWSASGKQEPSDFVPGGDTGAGIETIRRGPGGQSLISDLHMKFEKGGQYAGHGALYWDASASAYKGFWCESVSSVCEDAGTGHWEGDTLIFDGEVTMNGQKVTTRQTYSAITRESFTWTAEMKTADGMKPMLTFTYKRAPKADALKPDSAMPEADDKTHKEETPAKQKD